MSTHLHAEDPASLLRLAGRDARVDELRDASGRDDFDALTDLFLGSEDAPNETCPASVGGPASAPPQAEPALRLAHDPPGASPAHAPDAEQSVEALILSHLPVTSGPWAAQYAAALSRSQERKVALLTLLSDHTSLRLFGGPAAEAPSPAGGADTLDAAIAQAATRDPLWLVRCDASREAGVLASDAITGVVILTSADDAAAVAAYRVLKDVHTARASQRDMNEDGLRIRLGIIGGDDERADSVRDSLARAAKTFLSRPVDAGLSVASMTPTRSVALYDAESGHDPLAALAVVRRADRSAHPPAADAGDDRDAALETSAMRPESLARLVDPPFAPLPLRCPHEKQVELALDHAGALRLLVRKSPRAFEAAAIVRAWAAQHRELLELATNRRIVGADSAALHIFVESARDARRLLDAACAVHLIVRKTVRGEEVFFAIDL